MTKQEIINKVIKAFVADKRKSSGKKYIAINTFDLYYNNEKMLSKYFKDADDFAKDVYIYHIHIIDFKGYIKEIETRRTSGWCGDTYAYSVTYIANPCKEFVSLNKYITNTLKCEPLKIKDVYSEAIEGKRSTIFERYNTTLLAHDPEKCKELKLSLIHMRKSGWKANIDFKTDMYYGDRFNSYGEDMECEWFGSENRYAIVKFTTPSGRAAGELTLNVNR